MLIRNLFSSVIIYGTVNVIRSISPLLILPVLTAMLSVEEYGVLSLIETIILFVAPFISLSISGAISVEYYRRSANVFNLYFSDSIAISFISFLIFFSLSILVFISNIELMNKVLFLIPLFCFLRGIQQVILTTFRVRQEPAVYAKITIFQVVLELVLSYFFLKYCNFGLEGRLFGVYFSFLMVAIVGFYLIKNLSYLAFPKMEYSKDILKYVAPLLPHAVGGVIIAMSDRFFISYYIGNGALGIYSVAYQLSSILLLVAMSVNQAWSPMLFALLKKRKISYTRYYTKILLVFFLLSSLVLYLLRDILYLHFSDIKYHGGKVYFPMLLLSFFLQSLYFLYTNYLFFYRKTAVLAKITFFTAILNILLNYLLVVRYQVFGVLISTVVAWLIVCIVVYFVSRKVQKNEEILKEN